MSDATVSDKRFDDRVDLDTDLSGFETLRIVGRSLQFIGRVKVFFGIKILFAVVSVLPPLLVPWILKIIVDQVILQQPVDVLNTNIPDIFVPMLGLIAGLTPSEIMFAITSFMLVTLAIFGLRAAPAEQAEAWGLPIGYDAATQSEQALSAGGSKANGIWGLIELSLTIRMTQRLANDLRIQLMERLTRLEMTTLDDQRIGDSVYRVMYDSPMLPGICYRLTIEPLLLILGTVLNIYLMQSTYGDVVPDLLKLAVFLVFFILFITIPLTGLARRLQQINRAAGASTTNVMEESIENISAVQSLGASKKEIERFSDASEESYRRHRHTALFDALISMVNYICIFGSLAIAFVLISNSVIDTELTIGDYSALISMFFMLSSAAGGLGLYWVEIQKNIAAVRRVFFFIDHTSEYNGDTRRMRRIQKGIKIRNVDFSYPDGRSALKNINLDLPLGKVIAVVGPTGAGKTSLAYLLPGYLRPSAGDNWFDEYQLSDRSVKDIREQVTYVFQEHMLLSDSIKENLLLARPNATSEEIDIACKISCADEFIANLPDGIDTALGKAGNTISVGQKQRISIARGILRDTPIVILDEPTAALDPKTENKLMAGLKQVADEKLFIIIAHRLSTVKAADQIIFIEDGKISDVGSHDELMSKKTGRYRQFVNLQND